jgi:ABC-type amino acid transport substrate-binding protein
MRKLALPVVAALAFAVAQPAAAQEPTGTLKKIKDSGTITLGYREQSVPFAFKGDDGKPAGYSVDLCKSVATAVQQQLGLQKLDVKWVPVTVETRIPAVVGGTIDLECGRSRSISAT